MDIVLATRNRGKLLELREILKGLDVEMSALDEHPRVPDVVEDGDTFSANAMKKAKEVALALGIFALADDSGLVVDALCGAPGVLSARYAGPSHDYAANNRKLASKMKDVPDGKRQARFVCVAALASPDGRIWLAEGRCEGEIAHEPRGEGGFGYDPLFFIPEMGRTMAELPMDEKNAISHRGCAFRRMRAILVEILSKNTQI